MVLLAIVVEGLLEVVVVVAVAAAAPAVAVVLVYQDQEFPVVQVGKKVVVVS